MKIEKSYFGPYPVVHLYRGRRFYKAPIALKRTDLLNLESALNMSEVVPINVGSEDYGICNLENEGWVEVLAVTDCELIETAPINLSALTDAVVLRWANLYTLQDQANLIGQELTNATNIKSAYFNIPELYNLNFAERIKGTKIYVVNARMITPTLWTDLTEKIKATKIYVTPIAVNQSTQTLIIGDSLNCSKVYPINIAADLASAIIASEKFSISEIIPMPVAIDRTNDLNVTFNINGRLITAQPIRLIENVSANVTNSFYSAIVTHTDTGMERRENLLIDHSFYLSTMYGNWELPYVYNTDILIVPQSQEMTMESDVLMIS